MPGISESRTQMSSGFYGAALRVQSTESAQKLALGINWLCRALWAPSGTATPRSLGNPGVPGGVGVGRRTLSTLHITIRHSLKNWNEPLCLYFSHLAKRAVSTVVRYHYTAAALVCQGLVHDQHQQGAFLTGTKPWLNPILQSLGFLTCWASIRWK